MRYILKIQIMPSESESGSEPESEVDLAPIHTQMKALEPLISIVEHKFAEITKRMVADSRNLLLDPVVPNTPEVAATCIKLGLVAPFSLKDWFQAVLAVSQLDLETRTIVPREEFGLGVHTLYDLLRGIPVWFTL